MKKFVLMFMAVAACAVLAVGSATASPVSRSNAVREAHSYLESEAFSSKSLYQQLKFEGYSNADASYGVAHSGANWMKEAVAKAKEYQQSMPFSRSGLLQQLEFEGFTPAQALHGVRGVGL